MPCSIVAGVEIFKISFILFLLKGLKLGRGIIVRLDNHRKKQINVPIVKETVSYTHLRAHETS